MDCARQQSMGRSRRQHLPTRHTRHHPHPCRNNTPRILTTRHTLPRNLHRTLRRRRHHTTRRQVRSNMKKPCLNCGRVSDNTRCPKCHAAAQKQTNMKAAARQKNRGGSPYDKGQYRTQAKQVRANATKCHICKQGPKPNDPFQADHLIPIQQGGGAGPLAAAHRSCNIRRANKLRAHNPTDIANKTNNTSDTPIDPHNTYTNQTTSQPHTPQAHTPKANQTKHTNQQT